MLCSLCRNLQSNELNQVANPQWPKKIHRTRTPNEHNIMQVGHNKSSCKHACLLYKNMPNFSFCHSPVSHVSVKVMVYTILKLHRSFERYSLQSMGTWMKHLSKSLKQLHLFLGYQLSLYVGACTTSLVCFLFSKILLLLHAM